MGASLLAMDFNDNAPCLDDRVVSTPIASRLTPTEGSGYIPATRPPPKPSAPFHKPFGRCLKHTYPRLFPSRQRLFRVPRMPRRLTRTRGLAL
ncbi:hypothetical protein EJA72_28705 [Pseudomonas sp. PB120]|nr:hypothetical protein [Pseudomonas sp. PB120]